MEMLKRSMGLSKLPDMSLIKKAKQFLKNKADALSLLDISWTGRPYDFYLIFGQNEEDTAPWIKSNWDTYFEPYFDLLLKQTDHYSQTGIRVIKYHAEKRLAKKDNQEFTYYSELKLGRLRWDLKSHEKWTIQPNSDNHFQGFELWTPIWTACEKRAAPPDMFISISNENDFEHQRQIQFGYFIVIAIARNLKIDSEHTIRELSEKVNAKMTVVKERKWGTPEKAGKWTFLNWIPDTFTNGIYTEKSPHTIPFSELQFDPVWKIIYKQQ